MGSPPQGRCGNQSGRGLSRVEQSRDLLEGLPPFPRRTQPSLTSLQEQRTPPSILIGCKPRCDGRMWRMPQAMGSRSRTADKPRQGRQTVAHSVSYGSQVRANTSQAPEGRKNQSLPPFRASPKKYDCPVTSRLDLFRPCRGSGAAGADLPTACAVGYNLPPATRADAAPQDSKERKRNKLVLFPIRLDDAVMETDRAWAASLRRARHIGDFRAWKDHDPYQKSFERLLRDLKA